MQELILVSTVVSIFNFAFFLLPFSFFGATFAEMTLEEELVAAGGVVIDSGNADAPRVVLVHRPKYDDWSFPKGKTEPGESIAQTALREVKEETGLDCRILNKLAPVRYRYETREGDLKPKVVHYFLMERVGGRLEPPGKEVDAAEWWDAREAARKLTYQHDREVLKEALKPDLLKRGGSDG